MAKNVKRNLEFLLVRAEVAGVPEKALLKSRNIGCVDLIWPRTSIAKKSGAREMVFKRGVCDFTEEPWAKRCVFREEIDGHCGIAVSVSEPVSVQKLKRWAKLTAKAILKEGADIATSAMIGYSDIAQAPIDALATMIGEKDAPESIAQGVIDFCDLPSDGDTKEIAIPLFRPVLGNEIGSVVLAVKG